MSETWNREELYAEIWENPLVKVAAKYNISAVALGKVCRKLQIGTPCTGATQGLLLRSKIVAGRLIPVGKETDRRWEQGEDPSMLDSETHVFEKQGKMAVADVSDRKKWRARGVRAAIRKSGLSPTTVYAIFEGKPVRRYILETFRRTLDG